MLCEEGERAHFLIEAAPGEYELIEIEARPYCGFDASRASAEIVPFEGLSLGYVHFWYVQMRGPSGLLQELLEGPFADCDGVIVDLRGRGGSAAEVTRIVEVIEGDGRPCVCLTDSERVVPRRSSHTRFKSGALPSWSEPQPREP